jgi:uncharacterized membrane protein YagU involved in acid resistance
MLRQLMTGGVAGAVATLPMSGLIWGTKRLGLYHSSPPPDAVSRRLTQRLTGEHPAGGTQRALTTLSHVGFGAGAGAAYGATSSVWPSSAWTGAAFGLVIWLISYKGWLPALGLMPPPEDDERGRTVTLAAAHVVYGATLGLVNRRLA